MSTASNLIIPKETQEFSWIFLQTTTQPMITNNSIKDYNLHTHNTLLYSLDLFQIMIFFYLLSKFCLTVFENIKHCPESANLGTIFNLFMICGIIRWMSLSTFDKNKNKIFNHTTNTHYEKQKHFKKTTIKTNKEKQKIL